MTQPEQPSRWRGPAAILFYLVAAQIALCAFASLALSAPSTAPATQPTTKPTIVSLGIQYSDQTKLIVMHPAVLEAVRVAMDAAFPPPPATQPTTKPTTAPAPIKLKNADVKNYTLRGPAEQLLSVDCPDVWAKPRHAGPTGSADDGPPEREGSIRCVGGVNVFENLLLSGNDGGMLLGSSRKGMPDILCRNIYSDDGVALGRFQGGRKITIINYGSSKPSWAYPVSFFTDQFDEIYWDNSGIPRSSRFFWLKQGYRVLNGKENGEAILRFMWGHSVHVVGVNLKGVEYTGQRKQPWKQVLQVRSGGHAGDNTSRQVFSACEIAGLTELGWMGGGPDAGKGDHYLGVARFESCIFAQEPHINAGVGQVEYDHCFTGTYDPATDTWKNLKPLNKTIKGSL